MVRRLCCAMGVMMRVMMSATRDSFSASGSRRAPAASRRAMRVQRESTMSEPPVVKTRTRPSGSSAMVDIILRSDEKANCLMRRPCSESAARMAVYESSESSCATSFRPAPSVFEPRTSSCVRPCACTSITAAVELMARWSRSKSRSTAGTADGAVSTGALSEPGTADDAKVSDTPPSHASTTVIWFSVSVPVLSVQMSVALPIVSQASRWRMRFLSCSILPVE